jgi:solute carrier family 6 (neurotransmitter transporter, glycine) member 5/9
MKTFSLLPISKEVYNETANLVEGVGYLNWNLVGFLAVSWFIVFLILAKGIKSSGKASYVLAILPYIVLSIILGKALTLPGAMNGIKQFFTPDWSKLIEPSVWFAAVTQGEKHEIFCLLINQACDLNMTL